MFKLLMDQKNHRKKKYSGINDNENITFKSRDGGAVRRPREQLYTFMRRRKV